MENSNSSWFLSSSEIELGGSSVLGGNYVVFYIVHGVAISMIVTSFASSLIVIVSVVFGIWRNPRKGERTRVKGYRCEFADRFPLYQAVSDGLWSISHFVDHLYLMTSQRFPSNRNVVTFMGISTAGFLGYQQFMHAGLALYTYMRVVRGIDINLGKGEWKLHAVCGVCLTASILLFYPFGAFGPSGYWILTDVTTTAGCILGWYLNTFALLQAILTPLAYRQIKGVVERQKASLVRQNGPGTMDPLSTASECLTTFVIIGQAIYCPFALTSIAFRIQTMFGVIEPFTAILLVISANSAGWANALGYWHNCRVKSARRAISTVPGTSSILSNSTSNQKYY